ncbi:hypothetical protein BKA70DRAFT_1178091 [Coprinopsis sp. MPI-PUGE-AT-0042]|nr:hypothetical protein BKA70DRAFT_1178091 [Coprinopsis sp. MPI-PUGE-AT-0042]
MSNSREEPTFNSGLRPTPRHVSKHSVDTNASGLAESTISFSQFPPPPLEIPTTPIRNGFSTSTSSPVSARFSPAIHPLRPHRGPTKLSQADEASSARSFTSAAGSNISQQTQVPSNVTRGMSPHDWHDGSSSIDMDPTESRLLPTSLITSLLEENRNLRRAVRGSYTSDAFSGISEMTYPPPPPEHHTARRAFANPHRGQGPRNVPPSAFNPLANVVHRASADSATLQGQPGVIRSGAGGQGPVVVGVATATLRSVAGSSRPPSSQTVPMSIDEKTGALYGFTGHDMDDDSILRYKATGQYPNPSPPPPEATPRPRLRQHPQPSAQARQSTHSVAPSFVSRISLPASVRKMLRLRKKPLPPVPRIPDIPIAMERATQRAEEAAPLPDLAHRAHALHTLLEKGYHPHHSVGTYHEVPNFPVTPMDPATPYQDSPREGSSAYQTIRPLYYRDFHQDSDNNKAGSLVFSNQGTTSKRSSCFPLSTRTKWAIGAFVVAAFVGIIAGAATVAVRKKPAPTCASGLAGATCSLNSTCVCTSESRCNPLAQNLLDLIPSVNEAFASNFSSNDVYNSLWYMQGSPSSNDCGAQSLLVDVGKGLSDESHPNRTRWAKTALLWNAVQSQDPEGSEKLREFVQRAPWGDLSSADGPTTTREESFTNTFSGYVYNFAAQTISHPPASFVLNGQPTRDQLARVGSSVALSALDRTYMYAQASAVQQSTALKNYWSTTLSQKADDLRLFKARLSASPILLPFDALNPSIGNLFSNSSTSSFPPPLSCYPRLSSRQLDQINSFETSIFQLPSATSASNFSEDCFPDRPVYGVLDVFRLRLPFLDSDRPRQATVLRADAFPRAAMYIGDLFGASLSETNSTQSQNTPRDARRVGTLSFSDHVLLQYLTSISVETAAEVVKFVLATGDHITGPPEPSSPLFNSLSSVPPLEVAVFGDILSADIAGTVSSLNASSQALFFGTSEGRTFRSWAIGSRSGVTWAQNATSPLIVKDTSFDDETLNDAWEATSAAIRQNVVGIEKQLLDSFASTGKLTAN